MLAEIDAEIPYDHLAATHRPTSETWAAFVDGVLVDRWLDAYRATTPWRPHVMAIDQGALTYLYDAAPSLDALPEGDDRAVAAYGHSAAAGKRDRGRMAGFIPVPARWSGRGHDRGHLVAHGAGGGLDLNLIC